MTSARALKPMLLFLLLFLVDDALWHFSFSDSLFVHFLKQFGFELVISLLEVWNEPVYDVLKGDVLDDSLEWFSSQLNAALWTLISGGVLKEIFVSRHLTPYTHFFNKKARPRIARQFRN